jgi:multidrug transporter EmrE-like cation transporter
MWMLYLGLFIVMQVLAQAIFKWGSLVPGRSVWGLVIGNIFGVSSTWLLILLYRFMNVNVAFAIAFGLSFVCVQITLFLIFHSSLTIGQWAGISLITIGIVMTGMLGKIA